MTEKHFIDPADDVTLAGDGRRARWDERTNPGSVVYFIVADAVGMVKIGYSANVKQRMTDIAIGCPVPIRFAAFVLGSLATEREIHLRFRQYHSHGEWFRLEGELAAFVQEHAVE